MAEITYSFKNCIVNVNPEYSYTETVFQDGTKVTAVPQDRDEYRETARRLGYGDDTARCSREHELMHTWLAEKMRQPYSATLWAVAHYLDGGHEAAPEEQLVCDFQCFMNTGRITQSLMVLLESMRDEAKEFLKL